MPEKLVRDKVPELMRAEGLKPLVRMCESREEFLKMLLAKLAEEVAECVYAPTREERLKELADLQEVIDTLLFHERSNALENPYAELNDIRAAKRQQKGGFSKMLLLTVD